MRDQVLMFRRVIITTVLGLFVTVPCWGYPRQTISLKYDCPYETCTCSGAICYFTVGAQDVGLPAGGHPGGYLHAVVDAAEPQLTSTPLHPFYHLWLGDYTYSKIINLGVDINVFSVGVAAENRPVSLVLRNNGHTPDEPLDDCEIVQVGVKHVQRPGRGWKAFDFNVPYDSQVLPQSWVILEGSCKDLTPDEAWLRVIHDVTAVSYVLGEPGGSYDIQTWDLGFDNTRLTIERDGILPFVGHGTFELDEP